MVERRKGIKVFTKDGVPIFVAIVGVIGSIIVAFITAKYKTEDTIKSSPNLRAIDYQVGVFVGQQGDSEPAWTLDKNVVEGQRTQIKHVKFSHNFSGTPKVMISLSQIDADNSSHLRLIVFPTNIDETGFDVVVETWGNSKLYMAAGYWFAYQQ